MSGPVLSAVGWATPTKIPVGNEALHWYHFHLSSLFQGSAPILVVMVILLNIGVAILFINFFI